MKIAVLGACYTGLACAVLSVQHNEVVALGIIEERVNQLNQGIDPI